jgi:hypothetical protein
MLLEAGPDLGRPLADRVRHSRLSNLKELPCRRRAALDYRGRPKSAAALP